MPITPSGTPIRPPEVPMSLSENYLPIDPVIQIPDLWCWAATADMILDYYHHPNHDQCIVANQELNQRSCCGDPFSGACNRALTIGQVGAIYKKRNMTPTLRGQAVSFDKLKAEIDANRPVLVGYLINAAKHLAVVRGYWQDDQEDRLTVNDPLFGIVDTDYASLRNAYNLGTWIKTWVKME